MMYGQSRDQFWPANGDELTAAEPTVRMLYMTCANTWLQLSLFSTGSSSALLGRDVMLYSARTAPNYVCFDSNDGGNGGAAHMWPCDESNANQR
jgi:hypothetical protein